MSKSRPFSPARPASAPYRGSGRPKASYITERLIETATREIGIDRAELRRRNIGAGQCHAVQERARVHA
jgi:CO/xanthine dehydrogenase Mo-binding subunit